MKRVATLLLLMTGMGSGQYLIRSTRFAIPPGSPPTANLIAWFKSDGAATLDGSAVGYLYNYANNTLDAIQNTAANKPTYETNELNGNPILRFDGVNDSISAPVLITGSTCSVYMAIREDAALSSRFLVFGRNGQADYSGTGCAIINGRTNTTINGSFRGNVVESQITRPPVNTAHQHTCIWTGAINTAFFNGVAASPVSSSLAWGGNENLVIGAGYYSNAPGSFAKIDFGELLVYNVAHNSTQRQAIESYLRYKYALP